MSSSPLRFAGLLLLAFCTLGLFATPALLAQDLHPSRRPSPLGLAKTHVGDTYVKVTYGRPYMRNRAIFGHNTDSTSFLVPFGDLWRTGANEATEVTLTGDVTVAGEALAAGTYSIFTIPGETTWAVHFSPQLGLDGTGRLEGNNFTPNVYDTAQDVLQITVPSHIVDETVQQFTIAFEPAEAGTHLVMRWETTEVRIPIQ